MTAMNTAGTSPAARLALCCLLLAAPAFAQRDAKVPDPDPEVERKSFKLPDGFEANLFAGDPQLLKPVQMSFDAAGRLWVACSENYPQIKPGQKHSDKIVVLEDTDGDGKADKATVFADGFKEHTVGIGAGLLARRGSVWYTCIPDLWLLKDTNGDGRAEERKSLHHGYGVHIGYLGHDLHGLRIGPDGKLYFTIGDRGLNVKTEGRTLEYPDTGCLLRCNLDGSELEVVATGLRNPQELAFDQFGNLFTVDNNSDSGDKARLVYLVEGGDSGWRIGYQFFPSRGPWNREKLWHPPWDGQAANILPPLANISDGPSGLTYHPGVAMLPAKYEQHFFLADFRGSSGNSGIRSFAVKPKGAAFELTDPEQFLWSVLVTDVDFGPDGALYLSDWVEGWNKPTKGRLYKVFDPEMTNNAEVLEVQKLLAEDLTKRSAKDLAKLLEHKDQRVRQEAQFALTEKKQSIETFATIAKSNPNQLARLHAIWGLGQIGRKRPQALQPLLPLLDDKDDEVRAQAVKVLGDAKVVAARDKLIALVKDSPPRVRFFATLGLGKIAAADKDSKAKAIGPVLQMLRDNADKDAYLRHAGVMALTWIGDRKALAEAAKDVAPLRMAALLTLRRLHSPDVARFLDDVEPRLVEEAARAINDEPIPEAMPALAATISRLTTSDVLLLRAVNANFRLGKVENAKAVAALAARADAPDNVRLEALAALKDWAKPSGRDRVVGVWRPLEPRPANLAGDAIRPRLGGIFSGPNRLRQEAAKLAAELGIKEVGPTLFDMLADKQNPADTRVEMLRALDVLNDKKTDEAVQLALKSGEELLRMEGRRVLAKRKPAEALPLLDEALEKGSIREKQGALAVLATISDKQADEFLSRWLDKLAKGTAPPEVHLELLEAAAKRSSEEIKDKLAKFEANRSKTDPLANWRETLVGGDAENGRRIFFEKSSVYCLRCHKVKEQGGEVGPDLTKIGAQQKRDYLLEAIVLPSQQIAKGFDTVDLILDSGKRISGIVKFEDGKEVRLMTPEGNLVTIAKDSIDKRSIGKSSMPDDVMKHLTKSELRDLVEYLAGLK